MQYARHLHTQTALMQLTEKARALVISEANLALIGTNFSYADYQTFYDEHFAPLETTKQPLLNEPVWNVRDSEDEPSTMPAEEETPAVPTDNELFDIEEASPSENTDTEIIPLDDGGGNVPESPEYPEYPETPDTPDSPEDTQTSDDTIYFEDTPQPTQGTTKQKTTENTYDLEDEYYELDGF